MSDVLTLWKAGSDTMQIAAALRIEEHEVYNRLARLRKQRVYVHHEFRAAQKIYSRKLYEAGINGNERKRAMAKFIADQVSA